MEGEEHIGKFLVAGIAAYAITGVTAGEIVTSVARPAREPPADWPADKIFERHPEVRWPRRMLRAALKAREVRLVTVLPTPEEVETERAGKLTALMARDQAAMRKRALARKRGGNPEELSRDEWGRPVVPARKRA